MNIIYICIVAILSYIFGVAVTYYMFNKKKHIRLQRVVSLIYMEDEGRTPYIKLQHIINLVLNVLSRLDIRQVNYLLKNNKK
jgi:cbb3-type cytochrome oxidase subunit 3